MNNKIKALIFDVDGVLINSRIKEERQGTYGVNEKLLETLKYFKNKNFKLYLATNQNQEGSHFIWEKLSFKENFHEIFSSCYIGYKKPHKKFYIEVERKLRCKSDEVLFVDDREENVEAARKQGWKAYHYKNKEDLKKDILKNL